MAIKFINIRNKWNGRPYSQNYIFNLAIEIATELDKKGIVVTIVEPREVE